MNTFTVGTKEVSSYWLRNAEAEQAPFIERAKHKLEGQSVSSFPSTPALYGPDNAFYSTLSLAFNQHVPVKVSPDAVWLCILNGLTHHIDEDPEGLRHHFVEHSGKERLEVEVVSPPLPHVPDRVWEEGVKLFSGALQEHLGKRHDLIVNSFSTTTPTDKIASEIMLMGAMKNYFEYRMMLLCGLTEVTVLGEPNDWEDIKNRLGAMSEFNLAWWTDELIPIIDQFKSACGGDPDVEFWKRMYVSEGYGSGSQHGFGGWLCAFFPYLTETKGKRVRNPKVNWATEGVVDSEDVPSSLSFAPVTVIDHGVEHPFKFYGGLVGCEFVDGTLSPVSGWSIQQLDADNPG